MSIPPFPSKDMAKLVLGYLLEEQLMTAYDEFLSESPYLDALRNEYDRVGMYPLRNILAEYRAVKIYVETCKPVALRRKLLQSSNLLEVVKFLVQHIDVDKLQDPSRDRVGYDSEKVTTSRKGCDTCHSLKLESCVCSNKKRNLSSSKSINHSESIEAGINLVQTTPLSELPGNQVLQNTSVQHQSQPRIINQQEIPPHGYPVPGIANIEHNSIPNLQMQSNPLITSTQKQVCRNVAALQCSQNIAEFNTVLNQVYNKSSGTCTLTDKDGVVCNQYANNNRTPIAGGFQAFSTGVRGAASSNVNIPDSSTTEKINVPCSERDKISQSSSEKVQQTKKCVFRIGNVKHDVTEICSEVIDIDSDDSPRNVPNYIKPEDPKVTILSDVRVGNEGRLTTLPKNATSTPLLHMQTIYINNTPVYKPKPITNKFTFTRDEIMAMPTIILVPASGPSHIATTTPTCGPPQTTFAPSSNTAPTLPPLTVDVGNSSSNVEGNLPNLHVEGNLPNLHVEGNLPNLQDTQESNAQDKFSKPGLVKTVEVLKNASVPKDTVSGSSSSTPHMLPPQRKSSSTPRRTSHIRVLDFTTPRRILNKTISENPIDNTDLDKPVEVLISKSPNVPFPHDSIVVDKSGHSDTTVETDQTNNTVLKTSESDKNKITHKKSNWDADLRALVGAAERTDDRTFSSKPKSKRHEKKTTDEKRTDKNKTVNNVEKSRKKSSKNNASCSNKHPKKNQNLKVVGKPVEKVPSPTVSPTGLSTAPDKETARKLENVQNKSNDEERIDTPEVERLSLRNEIGAKLNISDILETPYKQALYEIQMETPRFLGPELPDEPMSDIKITDIPTPRFLSSNMPYTPKPTQPTPSSYSSRPTDYSSGGSYYKPDDQDYLPNMDDVTCPVTSTHSKDDPKKNVTEGKSETAVAENQSRDRSKRNRSRPVRQCTKNISYYSPVINKNTGASEKEDVSSCSDTISANSSMVDIQNDNMTTPTNDRKKLITTKSGKTNLSLAKKRSPLKRCAQKPFMKIKPRRTTPTKDSGRKNKKGLESSQLKGKSRVRTTSKGKLSAASCSVAAPTKSRRKSSTPRKLHCTKTFTSESSGHESPEAQTKEKTQGEIQNENVTCVQDSDTEQLPLRWSDDGSQDTRLQEETASVENETDDVISKIKEYIVETATIPSALTQKHNSGGSLQSDLVKRGFDRETAEKIERDLLNTPVRIDDPTNVQSNANEIKTDRLLERSIESDCSTLANILVINEGEDSDDLEFSVHECNEDSTNYIFVHDDESKHPSKNEVTKLKDKFSLEVCIDEGVIIRLRATCLNSLFELDTEDSSNIHESNKETEMAVSSISHMERLYTPMKDPIRDQCYEIFDSTLTSIDTPLKAGCSSSPVRQTNATIAEIIIEGEDVEEELEMKEKAENRKRKRLHCGSSSDDSVNNENKKVKPETKFMLQTKDIKDMDIEFLLTKLHGS